MSASFRWGVIGPGRIANRFASALTANFVGELYAVASRDLVKAQLFLQKHNGKVCYDNYQQLLADPNVDAVYIATPHQFHFEQAKACILAGKSVLVEKPLTVNAKQSITLMDLAKKHQVFLMEGMWSLFLPSYRQVDDWLSADKIGRIKFITSSFGCKIDRDENDRWLNPALAGGVLLDMGVYNVATSLWFHKQSVETMQASGIVGSTGVDELCLMNFKHSNMSYSQLSCSFLADLQNDLVIHGEKGKIHIGPLFWEAETVTLLVDNSELKIHTPFAVNGFEYQIAEVEACVRAGQLQSSIMDHQRTLQTMQIMDAVRQQLGVVYPAELD
ncbi:gfo/Idh/MocA family oxidoreductase [Saccharobesus litoralis]|uniref:Gfo/Idh/MocA family oxidoreductase n=1 Tax=Saccharobesus litoralis TaxID=2172099 RepID=A0A2S0VS54_9ALTE|nr:Gfo/Idh/MocA family oxidoreductase [Saccharobesus litoralis]AWB67023.1 gfo/Idh/MocA family oxidoreductase [Saccharobesus litoralis]